MFSAKGPDGPTHSESRDIAMVSCQSVECQLFESLVHHLIEKGVLTRNDALSVVQTVAEVKRGALEESFNDRSARTDLAMLKRLHASFEHASDKPFVSQDIDGGKVVQLRPPLHGDCPEFPQYD